MLSTRAMLVLFSNYCMHLPEGFIVGKKQSPTNKNWQQFLPIICKLTIRTKGGLYQICKQDHMAARALGIILERWLRPLNG